MTLRSFFPSCCLLLLLAMLVAEGCGTATRMVPGGSGNQCARPAIDSGSTNAVAAPGITAPRDIAVPPARRSVVSPIQRRLIDTARSRLGCRYKYASKGPDTFDCSGFMMYVFGSEGIRLNAGSASQYTQGRALEENEPLRPCDLVFFSGSRISGKVGHVGMVLDYDGRTGIFTFIHASCREGVEVQRSTADYYARRYIGARRILAEE